MKRVKVPSTTAHLVLLEAGYRCANPVCRQIITIDVHHIVPVKEGGGNKPDNLLALCPNCHALVHREGVQKRAVEAWKSLIVSLNNPNRASADILLLLYEEQKRFDSDSKTEEHPAPQFRFSGDSLGFLAGLITSGLAEISRRFLGAGMFGARIQRSRSDLLIKACPLLLHGVLVILMLLPLLYQVSHMMGSSSEILLKLR